MLPVMPSSLRDFWFPWSLACAGLASAMLGNYAAGNGRRVMLTLTGLFFLAAWLSYVWGDPVRGPFANLTNPHNPENFTFVAGTNSRIYGVSQLKDGCELGDLIDSMTGCVEVRQSAGMMGIITNGVLPRDLCYSHGVIFAFAPFVSDQRFWKP